MLSEQARVAKIQEQARLHLEQEIDNNRFDLAKQAQELTALEKEKDRWVNDEWIYGFVQKPKVGQNLIVLSKNNLWFGH